MSAEPRLDSLDPRADDNQDPASRRPIGEIFVALGFIDSDQLEAALEAQREHGGRIGEILVAQGSLTRLDLASALSEHWEPQPSVVVTELRRPNEPALTQEGRSDDVRTLLEFEARLRAAEQRLDVVAGADGPNGTGDSGALQSWQDHAAHVDELATGLSELGIRIDQLEESRQQADVASARKWIESSGKNIEARLKAAEADLLGLVSFEERLVAIARLMDDLERESVNGISDLDERLRSHGEELARLHEALAEVRRIADDGRVAVERVESISPDVQALTQGLAGLGAQLKELEASLDAEAGRLQELARFQDSVAGIHELVEQGRAGTESVAEDLRSELEPMKGQLEELFGQLDSRGQEWERLRDDLSNRLDELTGTLREYSHGAGLAAVNARLDELSDGRTDDAEAVRRYGAELSSRLEELEERVSAQAFESALASISARIDELHILRSADADANELVANGFVGRMEELAAQIAARDGAERERELLGERVDELASRIAGQEARAHDAAAVRALLADARERADQDRAETERVTESLRLEIGSLSGRLNELSGLRAAEMQETRRLRDDLSARLDELTARIGGQERHDAAVDPGAEDEAELWETRASAEDGVPAKQKPGKKRKKKRKRGD